MEVKSCSRAAKKLNMPFDLLVGKEVIQQLNVGRGIEIRYEARVLNALTLKRPSTPITGTWKIATVRITEENDSIVLNAHSMPSKSLRLDRAE